jgi:phosphoenolpyruvate phosphomutase-like protein
MNSVEQTMSTQSNSKAVSDLRTKFGDRRHQFRKLHSEGCFVRPNPWDVGSARYLQHLGFPALATTSAGFAFAQGLRIPTSPCPATEAWPISRRLLGQLIFRSTPTSHRDMALVRGRSRKVLRDVWRQALQDCGSRMLQAIHQRLFMTCLLLSSASRQRVKRQISLAARCY